MIATKRNVRSSQHVIVAEGLRVMRQGKTTIRRGQEDDYEHAARR